VGGSTHGRRVSSVKRLQAISTPSATRWSPRRSAPGRSSGLPLDISLVGVDVHAVPRPETASGGAVCRPAASRELPRNRPPGRPRGPSGARRVSDEPLGPEQTLERVAVAQVGPGVLALGDGPGTSAFVEDCTEAPRRSAADRFPPPTCGADVPRETEGRTSGGGRRWPPAAVRARITSARSESIYSRSATPR